MAATTRADIDAAHARLDAEEAAASPGQTDVFGGEVKQKDGGEIVVSYPEEIRVDGTTQLAAFDLGGKRPGGATLRLTGKVTLEDGTGLSKGEVITGRFTAVVREVGQKDKKDNATGIVVSCEQRHGAEIVDLRFTHE